MMTDNSAIVRDIRKRCMLFKDHEGRHQKTHSLAIINYEQCEYEIVTTWVKYIA